MKEEILKTLRSTLRNKVREDGIYLVFNSRYEESVRRVAKMVEELGGDVIEIQKHGKTTYRGHSASKTWRIDFTVGIDEDLYLAGRIPLSRFKELQKSLPSGLRA